MADKDVKREDRLAQLWRIDAMCKTFEVPFAGGDVAERVLIALQERDRWADRVQVLERRLARIRAATEGRAYEEIEWEPVDPLSLAAIFERADTDGRQEKG